LKGHRSRPPEAARAEALRILRRVDEGGAFATPLLEEAEARLRDPRDAALLHEVVLGVLRRRAALDHALAVASGRAPDTLDPPVLATLRIAAYELLHLTKVPAFASVDGAVRLVRSAGAGRAAGLVNAVLRRVARDGQELLPPTAAEGDLPALALQTSHPLWWVTRLVTRVGWERALAILESDNRPAPTVLRPALRRIDRDGLAARLLGEGVETAPGRLLPEVLRVRSGAPQRTRAWAEGLAWVQDEAAQLPARLLGPGIASPALDACAAPGGKTLQLAEAMAPGGRVVAMDRHEGRLRRLLGALGRVAPGEVLPLVGDAVHPPLAAGFAAVVVDAPCSGTGTFRRHPELRWRLRPEDPGRMAVRQAAILAGTAALVRPGGRLVYAVCSMEPEEGEQVVETFLRARPDWRALDPRELLPAGAQAACEGGRVRTAPDLDVDGFFAALLLRC
jgi:16S rRNA (cytosine967-C5)-methyltransferase